MKLHLWREGFLLKNSLLGLLESNARQLGKSIALFAFFQASARRSAEERVEVVNLAKEVASSREISLTLLIYFCDCKMINIAVPIPYF